MKETSPLFKSLTNPKEEDFANCFLELNSTIKVFENQIKAKSGKISESKIKANMAMVHSMRVCLNLYGRLFIERNTYKNKYVDCYNGLLQLSSENDLLKKEVEKMKMVLEVEL
jgi:hypothetical protein